jgi:hippurate hydrolase
MSHEPGRAAADAVLKGLDGIRSDLESCYRQLHSHPELGHQEHHTAAEAAAVLGEAGFRVHEGIGGTGVVGVLGDGDGPVVLLRADMDALPVKEATGLPYASAETAHGDAGEMVPVAHACGHDMHVVCLLGAARLLAGAREVWQGTLVVVFQPAEEVGDGARRMIDDGLARLVPEPDVALAQHVLPFPAGQVGTRSGSVLSSRDNVSVTVYGRGGHGSAPQATVDPVVMAAMIVVRLQTIVSRELAPTTPAVVSVGSVRAGTTANVIPESATIELNVRTYDETTRNRVLDAVRRIVKAECDASRAPREPEFTVSGHLPPTVNDQDVTERVDSAFAGYFGDRAVTLPLQTASEDFSDIPNGLGVPYTYWGVGAADAELYRAAQKKGTLEQDVPVNHSARFAPVVQPTLDTGVQTLVVAALGWLARTGTDD